MKFSHSGAIGDILYHLPVVKQFGGGEFYIIPADRDGYRTVEDMQYTSLRPLIEIQPYITKFGWSDTAVGLNFDGWRKHLDFSKNLTNQVTQWLGIPSIPDDCEPWLEVGEPLKIASVVLSRSTRNNFHAFPWKEIVNKYSKDAVFLGTVQEYAEFIKHFGYVPYYPTPDMLVAAKVIKGSRFFIGNPSGLLALSEGIKHKNVAASFPVISHCVFYNRPGIQHCWEKFEFWDV